MDLSQVLLLGLAGVITGAVNAVAGGGSLLSFPALLAVGLPPVTASVTNTVSVAVGYVGGAAGVRADLHGQRGRLLLMVPAAAGGAAVGCALLLRTPSRSFAFIAALLVLLASALMVFQERIARWAGQPHDHPAWLTPLALFAIGLYGGYFIAALGVVVLAALGLLIRDKLHRVVAAKNMIQLTVGVTAATAYALFGPVEWTAVAALVPGTLLGGYAGARLTRRLNARVLRWVVAGLGVLIAVMLFIRAAEG